MVAHNALTSHQQVLLVLCPQNVGLCPQNATPCPKNVLYAGFLKIPGSNSQSSLLVLLDGIVTTIINIHTSALAHESSTLDDCYKNIQFSLIDSSNNTTFPCSPTVPLVKNYCPHFKNIFSWRLLRKRQSIAGV